MKRRNFVAALLSLFGLTASAKEAAMDPPDLDEAIPIDAESLMEFGIKDAYIEVIPVMAKYDVVLAPLTEHITPDQETYSVSVGSKQYPIFDTASLNEEKNHDLWGIATSVFFRLINDQLETKQIRFYALSGGNELMGVVLTPERADTIKAEIDRPENWPYIPNEVAPSFGQYHSN